MKQLTVLFALLLGIGITSIQAQNCQKTSSSCCKKSASVASAGDTQKAGSMEAAAKLASLDDAIETRTCEKSGSVSYVRKVVQAETGDVTFADVTYDADLGQFVNVSPTMAKGCGTKTAGSSCCAGKKSAVGQSEEGKNNAKEQVKEVKSSTPAGTQTKTQKGS